jgi:sugar lactone lactonase YvrE
MKTRFWGVLAGVVVLGLVAANVTACGRHKNATATTVVVTTLAGKARISGSADGSGAAARFYVPAGIACDTAGNLYVADQDNNTVRKITPTGEVTTLAGKAGSQGSSDGIGAAARFDGPMGIACDTVGNLYVTDADNHTIRKITPTGVVTILAGKAGSYGIADGTGAAARFLFPLDIACDAAGNLYVADTGAETIRKITPAGEVSTLAGKARSSGHSDGSGTAARFNWPEGIACDAAGNVYVADGLNYTIRKITPTGVVTTLAGDARISRSTDGSGSAATFFRPMDIACDSVGNLYVTDNYTVRKIIPTGEVTTLAGKAGSRRSNDGIGAAARFFDPAGIVCDTDGNLYVTDGEAIRKITLSH